MGPIKSGTTRHSAKPLDKATGNSNTKTKSVCEGLITRCRITKIKTEKSVLDFYLVCDRVLPFVTRMLVDEKKQYVLSSYYSRKGVQYKKDSDHNPVVLWLQMLVSTKKPERNEHFNFKNVDCQMKFRELTNVTDKLTKCFENNSNLNQQSKTWFKELNSIFHQSFKKIRSNGKIIKTEVSELINGINEMKQKLKLAEQDDKEDILENIEKEEIKLSNLVAEKNRDKVINNFGSLAKNSSTLNINGMWAIKKKVFPKNPSSLPVAKKDVDGKIITSHKDLINLYSDTFIHRLRYRPIRNDYGSLIILKEALCEARLTLSKLNKSPDWTAADLQKVLSSLKNNKSRDPHGLINELV